MVRRPLAAEGADFPDRTTTFSAEDLIPITGTLLLAGSESRIEIPLQPFRLDDEVVRPIIHLDPVPLPARLEEIAGQTFLFPVNPEAGYIDGSVYLRQVHNPVDVTRIRFSDLSEYRKRVRAEFAMVFDFEYEDSGLPNGSRTMVVELEINMPEN